MRFPINYIVLLLSTIYFSTSFASDCSLIEDNEERLNCYDVNNAKTEIKNSNDNDYSDFINSESGFQTGEWVVNYSKDEMTGKESWMALNPDVSFSEHKNPKKMNSLHIACGDNTPNIFISWNKFIGSRKQPKSITIKLDNSEPYDETWKTLTNESVYRSLSIKDNVKFLKELVSTNELMARVVPYNSSYITAKFNLHGIEKIISMVKEDCPGKKKYWK